MKKIVFIVAIVVIGYLVYDSFIKPTQCNPNDLVCNSLNK